MIEAVHEFEGCVDKSTGVGILALFGAPLDEVRAASVTRDPAPMGRCDDCPGG
jgi:class 3 adenylate cyclase